MKILILYSILALCSCQQKKGNDTAAKSKETIATVKTGSISPGCYQMIIARDTALMNITVEGNKVSGTLDYNRFQKDDNKGTFAGTIDSSRVITWYNFQSEGMASIRQIIFKIEGNTMVEGYGDLELKSDTVFYKYPHAINYEEGHHYEKISCK